MNTALIVGINMLLALLFSLGSAPLLVWMERRVAGLIQDRLGPNRCHIRGFRLGGLIQSFADMLKLLFKEDFQPRSVHQGFFFSLSPVIVFVCAWLAFMVMPFADTLVLETDHFRMQALPIDFGLLWFLAFAGLGVYGVILGGWASHNKYSLLGAMRSASQMISYEAAMVLSLVSVLICYETVDLVGIVNAQATLLWGFIPSWGIVIQPVSALIFIITAFAEANRTPFDIAEGESEIVGGFHTEYSAMRFGLFFVGEYVAMSASSAFMVTLFLGGYHLPFVDTPTLKAHMDAVLVLLLLGVPVVSFFFARWIKAHNRFSKIPDIRNRESAVLIKVLWLFCALIVLFCGGALIIGLSTSGIAIMSTMVQIVTFAIKLLLMNFLFIWVRWTLPRFRYDQLQRLGWYVLLPLGIANVVITAIVVAVV